MLKFFHDNGKVDGHPWPFVYLHGQAESMNDEVWGSDDFPNASAPDICLCNEPISKFVPANEYGMVSRQWRGTLELECEVAGKPAVCVISDRGADGSFGGRIALVEDEKALAHVRAVQDWR